jgi:ATP-binding cassette subfamily C protein CydD
LLEAIAGLRPYEGSIRIDAVEVLSLEPGSLHAGLSMLGQRAIVFAGSIAENIRLGRRAATPEEVRAAARRARVTDFAADLPGGLATSLGENGLGLSGGEVHRVALARLYLRDVGLLLLDEPTAHLDARTEAAVLDGLLDFAHGRTMIVATHSTAVAARMDRCYRLVGGRLVPALVSPAATAAERGAA